LVARQLLQFIQKPRPGHRPVLKERDGELADAEVPVRMPCPLHFDVIAHGGRQRDSLPVQLIDDAAIVNAANFDLASILSVVQPLAALNQREDIDNLYAELALG